MEPIVGRVEANLRLRRENLGDIFSQVSASVGQGCRMQPLTSKAVDHLNGSGALNLTIAQPTAR